MGVNPCRTTGRVFGHRPVTDVRQALDGGAAEAIGERRRNERIALTPEHQGRMAGDAGFHRRLPRGEFFRIGLAIDAKHLGTSHGVWKPASVSAIWADPSPGPPNRNVRPSAARPISGQSTACIDISPRPERQMRAQKCQR